MGDSQADLFGQSTGYPTGFRYRPDLLTEADERALVQHFAGLDFAPFEFHGFLGKRRVVSFGRRYDFNKGGLQQTEDIPAFLLPIRELAATAFDLEPAGLQQVLLTEYEAGAAIGWHRDRAVFGDVVGLSLLSSSTFRFRKRAGTTWDRQSVTLEPRSAYLLQGPARTVWQHSIPPVAKLRYSITFRSLRKA